MLKPQSAFLMFLIVFLCGAFLPSLAQAQNFSIIRDTETEEAFRTWGDPVIRAAGLTPDQVNIVLVQNSDVNAFVMGGPNIFFYTGLIQKSENAGEIVGVMAHELGHITGGHLVRTRSVAENASFEAMIGTLLGLSAAILSGNGDAVAAGARLSQGLAVNRFLSHSRVQESSADQAGFRFLEKAKINPTGLVTFLQKLGAQELLPETQQSEYVRTHPLTSDRIENLRARLEASPYRNQALPASWADSYARVKAKLVAFTNPSQVGFFYASTDQSVPARYARAISAYRQNQTQSALSGMDELIRLEPNNPFFLELKGQMLYDFGRASEAVKFYEKALSFRPNAGLIRMGLANAIIDTPNQSKANLQVAIDHLKRAERDEPRSSRVKRLLATAYGKLGEAQSARVYLAEEALMQGRKSEAKMMLEDVLPKLPAQSPIRRRAQDLLLSLNDLNTKQNKP
jgi:predicted Zn-dependent protease